MNTLDWICIIVLVVSMIGAAASGFFMELFHLAGIVVGYVLAAWEGWRLAPWFEPYVKSQTLAKACGAIVVFMGVMIVAGISGKLTRWVLKEVGMRWFDRLLGVVFGLVRGLALCTLGVLALATVAPESHVIAESKTGPYFLLGARMAIVAAPEGVRSEFREGFNHIRKQQQEMLDPNAPAAPPAGGAKPPEGNAPQKQKPSEKPAKDVQSKPSGKV